MLRKYVRQLNPIQENYVLPVNKVQSLLNEAEMSPNEFAKYGGKRASVLLKAIDDETPIETVSGTFPLTWIDEGYIHVACDVCWNPPTRNVEYKVNSRITNNIFYDGTRLPIEKIDWTSLDIAEDYYVNLQLLTMGYENKVSLMYRTNPSATQAKGGCSTFRTLDVHNECMKKLRDKFPNFVELREKITKNSGEWSDKPRLAATISWKKAYQSSQINTLEQFFS